MWLIFEWFDQGLEEMSNHPKITCISSAHQNVEEKLRELQERFCHLQAARKEGRHGDLALLEAQISQNIREWQAELTAPSPESSLLVRTPLPYFSLVYGFQFFDKIVNAWLLSVCDERVASFGEDFAVFLFIRELRFSSFGL